MALMHLLSLCIGAIGGFVYGLLAVKHNTALATGALKNTFGVRFSMLGVRLALLAIALIIALQSGLFAPGLIAAGTAVGYIVFYVAYVVVSWM